MAKTTTTEDQGDMVIGNHLAADLADKIGDLQVRIGKLMAKHIVALEDEVNALKATLHKAGVKKAVGARHKVSISESIAWRLDKDGLAAEVGQAVVDKHSHPGSPSVRMTVTATKPAEAARRAAAGAHVTQVAA